MIGEKVSVLDHGYVHLVDRMGSDLSIVRSARVSYDAEWRSGEDEGKDEKLIKYLLTNKHTSPFESVVFLFEVKCPLFVARQWHRHRTWAYNEVSARYTELPSEFYVPHPATVGKQSESNKQMREVDPLNMSGSEYEFAANLNAFSQQAHKMYSIYLEKGIPRELARLFLPLNTYTRFFAKVDLHNLMHFLRLRLHPHAQWEIREYARALITLVEPFVPVTMKHFKESLS